MKLHHKYRLITKWSIHFLTGLGIVLAFFTLPPFVSAPIAIVGAVASWFAAKLIYNYPYCFVHSGIDLLVENNSRIGFCWSKIKLRDKMYPELDILYETRRVAKLAYRILRSWNFNSYTDEEENIIVSFVDEGRAKYSVFIYPGERQPLKSDIETSALAELDPNSEVELIHEIKPFLHNSADYSERPEMLKFIDSLQDEACLLLNTCYVKENIPVPYAKRRLRLNNFKFFKRQELAPAMIEYHQKWEDPNESITAIVQRVSKIKLQ